MQTSIDFGYGPVPWLEVTANSTSSGTPTIHLNPANGIPVASYTDFIRQFSTEANFTGMDCRGAWRQGPPPKRFNWEQHADDLIFAIESQHQKPVIGLGHSMGGTITLLAAIKRPELFSKLILIDPASLPTKMLGWLYPLSPDWLVFRLMPFIQRTRDRQTIWPSPDAFISKYENHPTYRLFTKTAMQDYAKNGLFKRSDGQYELLFSPAWEAHNFRTVIYLWNALRRTTHPTLLLRAEHTNMYSQAQFDKQNLGLPSCISAETMIDAHHLATHQTPAKVSKQILAWLSKST